MNLVADTVPNHMLPPPPSSLHPTPSYSLPTYPLVLHLPRYPPFSSDAPNRDYGPSQFLLRPPLPKRAAFAPLNISGENVVVHIPRTSVHREEASVYVNRL